MERWNHIVERWNNTVIEKAALTRLTKRSDITIKPADKGGAVVVWSRPLYISHFTLSYMEVRTGERMDGRAVTSSPKPTFLAQMGYNIILSMVLHSHAFGGRSSILNRMISIIRKSLVYLYCQSQKCTIFRDRIQ